MAAGKWVYVSNETLRLIKLCVGEKNRNYDDVIRDALVTVIEKGGGYVLDFPREGKHRVSVSDETHYLVNRLKMELEYSTQDELLFDVMVNYLRRMGMHGSCIEEILRLDV